MTIAIILIVFSFWSLANALEASQRKRAARRAEAERQRQREETARIAAEQKRMREEQRQATREQVERDKALLRLQKEQEKERKERLEAEEKQRKINEKLIKEQQKQAEAIRKLYARMDKAEDIINHFTSLMETLTKKRDTYQAEIDQIEMVLSAKDIKDEIAIKALKTIKTGDWRSASGYDADADRFMEASSASVGDTRTEKQKAADQAKLLKRKETLEGKVITLNNQIFAAEQKVKDAQNDKYDAECKIQEVA